MGSFHAYIDKLPPCNVNLTAVQRQIVSVYLHLCWHALTRSCSFLFCVLRSSPAYHHRHRRQRQRCHSNVRNDTGECRAYVFSHNTYVQELQLCIYVYVIYVTFSLDSEVSLPCVSLAFFFCLNDPKHWCVFDSLVERWGLPSPRNTLDGTIRIHYVREHWFPLGVCSKHVEKSNASCT